MESTIQNGREHRPDWDGSDVLRRVRREHTLRVLLLVAEQGPLTRREIGSMSGLSRTTVSAIAAELIAKGTIEAAPAEEGKSRERGRPVESLRLNPRAGAAIGIEFGRGHIGIVIANVAREIIHNETVELPRALAAGPSSHLQDRAEIAATLLRRALKAGRITTGSVLGLGVAVSGYHPDPHAQNEGSRPAIIDEFAKRMGGLVDCSIVWDNNIRLAALAEARYGATPTANLLYVVLAHGVGGGLVINNTPIRGASGIAGEVGHVSVEPSGPVCWCGRTGCLELYLSTDALIQGAKRLHPRIGSIRDLREAAERDDGGVRQYLHARGTLLGRALAALVTSFDPERVMIGGEGAELGDALLAPAFAFVASQSLGIRERRLEMAASRMTSGAPAAGAMYAALERAGVDLGRSAQERTE